MGGRPRFSVRQKGKSGKVAIPDGKAKGGGQGNKGPTGKINLARRDGSIWVGDTLETAQATS